MQCYDACVREHVLTGDSVLDTPCPRLAAALTVYTVVVNACLSANRRAKLAGPWTPLEQMPDATCVLTGGAQGLGACILRNLLAQFPRLTVVVVDVADPAVVHRRVRFLRADLSKPADVERVLEQVTREYSRVDVLINCAGMRSRYQGLQAVAPEELHKTFQVNVFAPQRFIQKLAPRDDRQFYLVTVGSTLGILAPARLSAYAATKAATIAYHDSWTFELLSSGRQRVRTLLVVLGQMDTRMFQGFRPPRQFLAPVLESEELARRIVHCCSIGMRGQLCAPLYVNFMYLVAALPYTLLRLARQFSQMDVCLPEETDT